MIADRSRGAGEGVGAPGFVRRTVVRGLRRLDIPICRYPPSTSWEYHIRQLVRTLRINCVFDVGAHHGEFVSRMRGEARYSGTIVSFEPARDPFAFLSARYADDPRWRGFPCALGDADERRTLKVYPMSLLNSFCEPSEYGKREWEFEATGSEDVEVRTVDGVLRDLSSDLESSPQIFLKVDTQGFDLAVVNGAKGSLSNIPALQLEIPLRPLYEGVPTLEEALPILRELGYEVSAMFPVARDPIDGLRLVEVDCVLVRSDVIPNKGKRSVGTGSPE